MPLLIRDLTDILQQIAPFDLAEPWDNVGLLVGDPKAEVRSVLIALDPLSSLLDEAEAKGANVIITHHPVIFHPLKALRTDQPIGNLLARAARKDIHIIACHTNLDSVTGGVSDILAEKMNLQDIAPLISANNGDSNCGLGRIGKCRHPMKADECIELLRTASDAPWLLEAGCRPAEVKTIAVCGGSCSEYAETAMEAGADLFITAEVKHAIARWAEEAGFWIIDGGHFSTEQLAVFPLKNRLQNELTARGLKTGVHAVQQNPPLTMV